MKRKIIYIFIGVFTVYIIFNLFRVLKIKNDTESKEYIIGMAQSNLYEPWRINMNNEIKEEAKNYDNIKIIYKDAGGEVEKQKQDINDLINFGADLLIVSINDKKELAPVIKDVYKRIPVIILDRAVEGYDYTLYIGGDMKSIGNQAGEMVNEIADGNKIKVVEIEGAFNSSPDEEMNSGFKEVIEKNRNVSIDRTIIANWNKNDAEDKVKELLKEDDDINVIFAHSDYMALGAYYAVHSMGKNNIKIIGVDGLQGKEGGIELVRNGALIGTFKCNTGGKQAVQYAVKILNKEDKSIPKKILLECNKITKETLSCN